MNDNSLVKVEQLCRYYGALCAVNNISFEIQRGEVLGFLGPNGAGKTTSFYMIVGLVAADRGSIYLDGKDITPLPLHLRARNGIGYLPQEASIFRKLSVADNIMAILQTRSDLSRFQQEQKQEELLEELHITHIRHNIGISLSGGERRRVEIARALASEPRFMLLDEPFAGVDAISIIDIKRIISYLSARNIGVLITDHNVRETLDICDRAYIVSAGRIIAEGTPDEVRADPKVKEAYLGSTQE